MEHTADPAAELTVTVERGSGGPVLRVVGELDVYGAPLVAAMVEHTATGAEPVVVDLSEVSFADSHGLAPLTHPGVRILWASSPVRRLLRLLGLPGPSGAGSLPPGRG